MFALKTAGQRQNYRRNSR